MQGMRETYGDKLRFIVFDVKIDNMWLSVLQAQRIVEQLILEFVDYNKVPATVEALDKERDLPSSVGRWRGFHDKKREGVVLRPIVELYLNNGKRIISKHKRDDFCETKTPRIVSEEELKVFSDAKEIAEEWVTSMRLTHILDKVGQNVPDGIVQIENMRMIIEAMWEDVEREAEGEIVLGKATRSAVANKTAKLFKQRLQDRLKE